MKKTALITGASSGIGKELAKIHAQRGGDLIIVARTREDLSTLKHELESTYGIQVHMFDSDLTKDDAVENLYAQIKDANINVDYLINNAGFGGIGKFHEREWEKDLAMIQLNIIALTALSRKFLPEMVARGNGKILNVSSTASLLPGPMQAVYYATKAYVTSFSNAIAEELHDTGITVTALLPGATDTNFAQRSGMDKTDLFSNPQDPREVALAGYDAMLAGKLDVMAGLTFAQKIMMKSVPFTPKSILLKQVRKMQEPK
ncbi:SDR family oxidoreductase [Gangjinia marincola]|uniref:SDR family oxidoreductase n=1 Tax=Gangjinia marincola TaxID=578463 RepID=A0ABN1MGB0_9FLAO